MFAKQIYRLDETDSKKCPYLKAVRNADCQAMIDQELYTAAEKLLGKKTIADTGLPLTWVHLMENGLKRFVDENSGVRSLSQGVSLIRPLQAEKCQYMRKERKARFLARIQLEIFEAANKLREKRGYTWVYIIEAILEQFLTEK